MKKYLVLFAAFFSVHFAASAQKPEKRSYNKISGDSTFSTTLEQLYGKPKLTGSKGDQLYLQAFRIKDRRFLAFTVKTLEKAGITITGSHQTEIKLADNSLVILKTNQHAVARPNGISRENVIRVMFLVPKADIQKLAAEKALSIKIAYTGGAFEFSLKNAQSQKLNKICGLVE